MEIDTQSLEKRADEDLLWYDDSVVHVLTKEIAEGERVVSVALAGNVAFALGTLIGVVVAVVLIQALLWLEVVNTAPLALFLALPIAVSGGIVCTRIIRLDLKFARSELEMIDRVAGDAERRYEQIEARLAAQRPEARSEAFMYELALERKRAIEDFGDELSRRFSSRGGRINVEQHIQSIVQLNASLHAVRTKPEGGEVSDGG